MRTYPVSEESTAVVITELHTDSQDGQGNT
jgi:hypothetical protein